MVWVSWIMNDFEHGDSSRFFRTTTDTGAGIDEELSHENGLCLGKWTRVRGAGLRIGKGNPNNGGGISSAVQDR